LKLFIFLLFISLSSLEANYCVQVATSNKSERNYILNEANNHVYNQFNDLRVEPRGDYYVLRIGDYEQYSDAQHNFDKIKRLDRDAYIRKCDFLKEQAIFIKNESKSQKVQEGNTRADYDDKLLEDTTKHYRNASQDKVSSTKNNRSYKREDSHYESNADANSLWNDCKKCFVPLHTDEDEYTNKNNNQVEQEERIEPRKSVNTTQRVKQRVEQKKVVQKSENIDEEIFWRDEIGVDEYRTSDTQQKREKKINDNEENLY